MNPPCHPTLIPELVPHVATGIFPQWIPAADYLPDTPRVVLASDGEGVFTAVCERTGKESLGGHSNIEWFNASTEEPFDSVILEWMESPEPTSF